MRPLSIVSFAALSLVSANLLAGLFSPTFGGDSGDTLGPRSAGDLVEAAAAALPAAGGDEAARTDVAVPSSVVDVAPVPQASPDACPANMVLVEGQYCPKVKQECVKYMEDPIKFPRARCQEFAPTSECQAQRIPLRFCMDKLEAANGDKDKLPVGDISWTDAKAACEADGKRLCQEREWVLACEGDLMQPYPYGFVRDSTACNFDHVDGLVTNKGDLADLRQPVDANPRCESPYGIRNMVGNIDEWVVLDKPHFSDKNGGRKMMSGLKGGWWGPMRNRCRPTTVDHDEIFHELQTGYRCCANAH
jgi:formylglycine-generating enzyme required for sulfatase activity